MPTETEVTDYESFEPTFPLIKDVGIKEWKSQLKQSS